MEHSSESRKDRTESCILVDHVAVQHFLSGYRFPEHVHHTAELLICLSGSMTILVKNETIAVKAGEYFLSAPHCPVSAVIEEKEPCSLLQLYLTMERFPAIRYSNGGPVPLDLELLSMEQTYLHQPCPDQLRDCAKGIYEEYPSKWKESEEMLQHYVCQLELLLSREIELYHTKKGGTVNPHLLRACSYIRENCCSHLTVTEIADNCHISTRYLRQLFSEHLHTSVCEYLSEVRIQTSIELLQENPEYPMARLALDVGFSSQQHFSTVFKEIMSVSPKRYLAQNKREK